MTEGNLTRNPRQRSDHVPIDQTRLVDLVAGALVLGLVAGLVEGIELLGLESVGLADRRMGDLLVPGGILWVAPVVSVVVFLLLALGLSGVRRIFPRLPLGTSAAALMSFLAFLDWLVVSGYIADFPGAFFLAMGLASVFTRWFLRHRSAALAFGRRMAPWALATVLVLGVLFPLTQWARERLQEARLPAAKAGLPNIVVVVLDTMRADHMSVYGYRRQTTPNLERFARGGVLFENAFSTSSWTLPAHASMLTGRYPHEHGAERGRYDGRYTTLPQELTRLGYRTAAFSANLFFFTQERGFGQGFLHFEGSFQTPADKLLRTFYGREFVDVTEDDGGPGDIPDDIPARHHASDINRAALRWIRREPGKPFFAMLNYFDTHEPYLPPEPYAMKFSQGKKPYWLGPQHSAEQLEGEIDAYDGAVSYVDDQIAELFGQLAAGGYGENTLMVVISDHGESFGEHGLVGHGNVLYPQLTHVPLMFSWPGHIPAGAHIATPVSIAELPATLMELLGQGRQDVFPGPSLAQLWESPEVPALWLFPMAELARDADDKKSAAYLGWAKCLMTPEWYYIVHQSLPPELYSRSKDPGAFQNLAASPEGTEVVRGLETDLEAILKKPNIEFPTRWPVFLLH